MRTIYLVNGQNDMNYEDYRWWNVQAFASKEDAERFIIEKEEEYQSDMMRILDLEDKWDEGVITDEEKDEISHLDKKWQFIVEDVSPKNGWSIAEIQFQE